MFPSGNEEGSVFGVFVPWAKSRSPNFMRARWGSKTGPLFMSWQTPTAMAGAAEWWETIPDFLQQVQKGAGQSWVTSRDAALGLMKRRKASGKGTCPRQVWDGHSILASTTGRILIHSPPTILAVVQEDQMDPCLSKHPSLRQSYLNLTYLFIWFQCGFQWIYCFKEYIVFICRLFHDMAAGAEHAEDECNQVLWNILYFHH